jgi:3-methyladenine DNA glycosylase/8-oxoguanine DNA glycosylase
MKRNIKDIQALFEVKDLIISPVVMTVNYDEWFSEVRPEEYFIKLCQTIIGQQLSGKAADTIEARVRDLLPKHMITPEHILSVDDQSYRDAG